MTPAAIMYAEASAKPVRSVIRYRMSKITAVLSSPSGRTIRIGWIA
jgi:hypothetical protein